MTDDTQGATQQPFVYADLRPTVGTPSTEEAPSSDRGAQQPELQQAAYEVLSEHEQQRIQRSQETSIPDFSQVVVTQSTDIHSAALEDEAILLNLENGHYYTLNRVGTAAWELFQNDKTLQDVHQALCDRFDVSEDRLRDDLVALVGHLSQEGLIIQQSHS